ncbi:hypothetical protein [Melittangium boletus]|uniref:Methyltransferase domain-containing protein n=1 Tax=Melittangium boletus DSM 14713 TaxID=1294270 RepID=A0A250IM82_9BACT|nr:hypothetical protein [Melittangium boletus]ATB32291.1 hypothetical protein MEBOL_005768 [Melittangium boletus DSM 14713]
MPGRPDWLVALINTEVDIRIRNDARTMAAPNTFLGYPKDRIFQEVLGGGQADFDAPIGKLTGEDRALLYAKYNQSRHLDELGEAFDQLFSITSRAGQPTLIDLGCGPFTAGLALAATLNKARAFRYHGFDRADSMRGLGARFAETAKRLGAFHPNATWSFGQNLDIHDFGRIRGDLTLVVASYLLASPTVDVESLVGSVVNAVNRIGPGPAAVLYTNSAKPGPNKKYPSFSKALRESGFELKRDHVELFQKTKNPADLRYALFFRPATTVLKF